MLSENRKINFVILWLVLGIVQGTVGMSLLDSYLGYGNDIPPMLFSVYFVLTLLAWSARKFLLSNVLGLRLEGWSEKTALGTIGGIVLAGLSYWLVVIVQYLFFYIPYVQRNAWTDFFSNLGMFSIYFAFRCFLIKMQYGIMNKPQKSWLYSNLSSAVLVWLVVAFHFAGFGTLRANMGLILPMMGVAASELLIAYSYIQVKLGEFVPEKRKVEEL